METKNVFVVVYLYNGCEETYAETIGVYAKKEDAENSLHLEKEELLKEYIDDEVMRVKTDLPDKFIIEDGLSGIFTEVHIEEKTIQ